MDTVMSEAQALRIRTLCNDFDIAQLKVVPRNLYGTPEGYIYVTLVLPNGKEIDFGIDQEGRASS